MGDKSGLAWPQIVSQSYTFCSPMPIVGVKKALTRFIRLEKKTERGMNSNYSNSKDNHTTAITTSSITINRIGRIGLAKGKFSAPEDFDTANEDVEELLEAGSLEPSEET